MRKSRNGGVDVVFDTIKRKEFLTGFRKRKNHRRKCVKEELERSLKKERKRIRREIKDEFKHLTKSYEPLNELSGEDDDDKSDVSKFEDENVKLKIVNLNTQDLSAHYYLLGENQSKVDRSEKSTQVKAAVKESHIANYVPGMDYGVSPGDRRRESDIRTHNKNVKNLGIHNKTQIDHFKKIKSWKQMQRSRIFQMKERIDRSTNKKRARQKKNKILKSLPNYLKRAAKMQQTNKRYLKRRFVNGNRKEVGLK